MLTIRKITIFLAANPKYDLGKPLVLDKPMFCVCGFSANSGNKLAKHLGQYILETCKINSY